MVSNAFVCREATYSADPTVPTLKLMTLTLMMDLKLDTLEELLVSGSLSSSSVTLTSMVSPRNISMAVMKAIWWPLPSLSQAASMASSARFGSGSARTSGPCFSYFSLEVQLCASSAAHYSRASSSSLAYSCLASSLWSFSTLPSRSLTKQTGSAGWCSGALYLWASV